MEILKHDYIKPKHALFFSNRGGGSSLRARDTNMVLFAKNIDIGQTMCIRVFGHNYNYSWF